MGTQAKVSLISRESQQQESVTTALAPLSIMSYEALHRQYNILVQLLDRAWKKTSPLSSYQLSCYVQRTCRTVHVVAVPPLPLASPLNVNNSTTSLLVCLQRPKRRTRVWQHHCCPLGGSQHQWHWPKSRYSHPISSIQENSKNSVSIQVWGKETARKKPQPQQFFLGRCIYQQPCNLQLISR